MTPGVKTLPPSRRDKKQIVAHLDPALVEAVHRRRAAANVTAQEVIAEAVNRALAKYGRSPILAVRSDRVVKRKKALARVQSSDQAPACRAGKRRIAGWFDAASVNAVVAFAAEVGVKVEQLVNVGLRETVAQSEIDSAAVPLAQAA